MARKFFYVCAGMLCLMAAYALGARTAGAVADPPIVYPVWVAFSMDHRAGSVAGLSRDGGIYVNTLDRIRQQEPAEYLGTLIKSHKIHADPRK